MMEELEKINSRIADLWDEYFRNDDSALFPLFYPELKRNSLLFIGCNPAFNDTRFNNIFRDTEDEGFNYKEFYLWKNRSDEAVSRAARIETNAKTRHNYFKKFPEISKYVGLDWEHIDLFLFRETNQKNAEKRVSKNRKKRFELNDFGKKQFEIARELISLIEPKVIVIANAYSSQVFQNEFDCVFNDELGCHFTKINSKNTPVFFTSMLTGQRALDNGSMIRLKWHIKRALAYNND